MVKTHTTISIDSSTLEEAKKLGIVISKACNEYLEALIKSKIEDSSNIDIELAKMERNKQTKVISEAQAKLNQANEIIRNRESFLENEKLRTLQEEKARIESSKKCAYCRNLVGSQPKVIDGEQYCNDCFMAGNLKK